MLGLIKTLVAQAKNTVPQSQAWVLRAVDKPGYARTHPHTMSRESRKISSADWVTRDEAAEIMKGRATTSLSVYVPLSKANDDLIIAAVQVEKGFKGKVLTEFGGDVDISEALGKLSLDQVIAVRDLGNSRDRDEVLAPLLEALKGNPNLPDDIARIVSLDVFDLNALDLLVESRLEQEAAHTHAISA